MMKTTICIEPCFSSRKGTIRLFAALAFCAASILALGCKSTGCNSTGCGISKSDDPGKLATVESGDSDSVSRGQSSDADSTNVPSAESAERHDRLFSETQKNDSQTTSVAESSSASTTLATNDVSKGSPIIKEDINSMDFVPTTTEPTTKSTIPDVTPAPKAAPQVPAIPNEVQTLNQNAGTMENAGTKEQVPSNNGYQSVAPSPGQANQGATGEYSANSAQGNEVGLEAGKTESNKTEPNSVGNVTTEPPVEMSKSDVPSTFANEGSASLDSTKQATTNSEASEGVAPSQTETSKTSDSTSTSTSSTQPSESDASRSSEKLPIVAPTLDAGVPVTFKPTAFSRVVEVQTTSASNFLDSRSEVARQSETRQGATRQSEKQVVSGGVSLITSESTVGKPIDASKDVARLKRIRSR